MRHVTSYDAAVAAVRALTEGDTGRVISIHEIVAHVEAAGHTWPRSTIVKVVSRNLAGIGTKSNTPSYVPILVRVARCQFRLR